MSQRQYTVTNDASSRRFQVELDHQIAFIDYYRVDSRILFTHTEVPRTLEGQGIAGAMAKAALEFAQAEQLEVVPLCPFVRGYIDRHPQYEALVGPQRKDSRDG
jgi:hypothetical protein